MGERDRRSGFGVGVFAYLYTVSVYLFMRGDQIGWGRAFAVWWTDWDGERGDSPVPKGEGPGAPGEGKGDGG